jgi:Fibronectin type III domain
MRIRIWRGLFGLMLLLSACKSEFTITDKVPSGPSGLSGSSVSFSGLSSIDNISGTTMRLNWTNVGGAQYYQILNMTSGTPSWVTNVTAPTATYTMTGLSPSTVYKFRVRLVDSQGLSDTNTNDLSATTATVTGTFNGWTNIKALGPKTPAAQASDIASASAAVTLTWSVVTVSSGAVASYNIYRATSSGGENYASPLATGISAASPSYTDSTVTGGTTFYYTIAPVVSGVVVIPSAVADSEVKVIVPRDNMVLLHRWAANNEMCGQMGKAVDRNNNYRCTVATGVNAPPGTGGSGFLDLGASLFVDAYGQGCNYTYSASSNKCGSASGCIGTLSNPSGSVTGNNGDIYYSRKSGYCFINTSAGSGTSWTIATSASAAQRQLMGSAAPGLPPFVLIDQPGSQNVCSGQGVTGFAGVKRLLKRREQVLVAAWDSSLADATIDGMENGVNLDTSHNCNSNYASPQGNTTTDISGSNPTIAYDNLAVPAAKDTLPGCRFGDCASTGAAIRSVRTGSSATSACVSRYGAQDMVGNVWQWTSDQISCNGATCSGVPGASNSVDTTNDDFSGLVFDGNQGPTTSNYFTNFSGKIQFPIGIPIANGAFAGDGTVARTATQFHNDYFWINPAAATYGSLVGGRWLNGSGSGRFALYLGFGPSSTYTFVGFRCALPAE